MLFYLMIKNHPFKNGNKRIAVMTLLVFFYLNRKWLSVTNDELYRFAVGVAAGNPKLMEENLVQIKKFLKEHLINF